MVRPMDKGKWVAKEMKELKEDFIEWYSSEEFMPIGYEICMNDLQESFIAGYLLAIKQSINKLTEIKDALAVSSPDIRMAEYFVHAIVDLRKAVVNETD